MQVHMVAALYADANTARLASVELQRRVGNFDPAGSFGKNQVKGDEPRVYTDSGTGLAVAIGSISYPLPPDQSSDGEPRTQPGLFYRIWMNALYRREFLPLATTIPSPN